jgi:DNA-binding NarL/FixJ family response regulator
MKIKISISDDHLILAETLRAYLSEDGRFEVLACYANSSDTMEGIRNQPPNVLLLDLSMPEKGQDSTCLVTGLDVLSFINSTKLPIKVIVLSNFDNYSFVKASIKQGASGYLLKNEQPDFLRNAIIKVYNNKAVFSDSIRKKLDYLDQADTHS